MYLEHFGLNEPPFRITPHTDFFFAGANRGATLDALVYAITHDEGIVKVSGEVGSGKTMLCRVLMERLPKHVTIIYLANPSLSRDDILFAIADELSLDVQENARTSAVMRALHDHLIESYGEGRQVVVLVDEAHAMPVETLEEIRLLSNLESRHSKLLQLVLFGQPELNDVLARPDMRQLKERITHNFSLEPLVRDDITQYLDFRMRAAGYRGPSIFSPPALKMIAQSSLGLTRRINILADKALLAAFSSGSHQIGLSEVKAAIRDCEFSEATYGNKPGRKSRFVWVAALLAAGAVAGMVWPTGGWLLSQTEAEPPTPAVVPIPAAPDTAAGPAAAAPSAATGTTAAEPSSPADNQPPSSMPSQQGDSIQPNAVATSAASPSTPRETEAAPNATESQALPSRLKVGKLTLERLEAGAIWQKDLSDDRWFIQIFSTTADRHAEIEALLRRVSSREADMNKLHVYYSELSGGPRFGIVYGDYPTRSAAVAAMRGLPDPLLANKPYARRALRLR
ncbi:MAG: AAA family ATPase [Polynucleobacter sp.]|nr:AAA family ATPase [Polynucleobacter sp.]